MFRRVDLLVAHAYAKLLALDRSACSSPTGFAETSPVEANELIITNQFIGCTDWSRFNNFHRNLRASISISHPV